ncbi:MAG: archease [Candidatus Schekmanbacteria bacterium]|nr:archease [Candidatus Schekmanbacteria bacterium]
MPFRYLDDVAIADVAIEAWAETLEDLFRDNADAMLLEMVENLDTIAPGETRQVTAAAPAVDRLLHDFLQEIIFFKDAECKFFRPGQLRIAQGGGGEWSLDGTLTGEPIDHTRHAVGIDVKAVTMHRLTVERAGQGWKSLVILDI